MYLKYRVQNGNPITKCFAWNELNPSPLTLFLVNKEEISIPQSAANCTAV